MASKYVLLSFVVNGLAILCASEIGCTKSSATLEEDDSCLLQTSLSRTTHTQERIVYMSDAADNLQEAVERFSDIAVSIRGYEDGSISHFYHMVLNLAFPIYAKLVMPFVMMNKTVPRRRIHLPNVGGVCTAQMMEELIPDFNFNISRWVPYKHIGSDPAHPPHIPLVWRKWIPSKLVASVSDTRPDIPLFWISGAGLHNEFWTKNDASVHGALESFRAYVLAHSPLIPSALQPAPTQIFLNRAINAIGTVRVRVGVSKAGSEKRSIANANELMQALKTHAVSSFQAEGTSFTQQVSVFRNVNLFIGQHGAGLLHCLWMPNGSSIVEIATPETPKFFEELCGGVRGLEYRRFLIQNHKEKDGVVWAPVEKLLQQIQDLLVH